MSESTLPPIAPQFESAVQQRQAALLGMWLFLSTETLLFGGMIFGYAIYRMENPAAFLEAGRHTLLFLGTVNTGILLFSSFLVALAVHRIEQGARNSVVVLLGCAAALGCAFLVVKGFEYAHEIHEGLFPGPSFHLQGAQSRPMEMFYILYFTMTALHGVHVAIGVGVLSICAWKVFRSKDPLRFATMVDLAGLYWHFVDIIWVFLFPLFYLLGRSQ